MWQIAQSILRDLSLGTNLETLEMSTQRNSIRRAFAFCCGVAVISAATEMSRTAELGVSDVGSLFSLGALVQDRNGDGIADSANCRIVVAADAPAVDIVAAANIAGRIGFETSALKLPLGITDFEAAQELSGPPLVLVGASNALVKQLVEEGRLSIADLQAKQGMVAILEDAFGTTDAVVVVGADDAGLLAAGNAAAARLPFLWQLRGTTISRVETDVRQFLSERGVRPGAISARRVFYSKDRDYADRLELQLQVPESQAQSARSALQEIAESHVVGKAVFTERQADRLNYPELAELAVGIVGARSAPVSQVVVPRFGPGYRNRFSRNPLAPSPREISLSSLFTREGLLMDTRGDDFIPDETATTIILDDAERGLVGAIDLAARIGMESMGVDLPLARLASEIENVAVEPNPILIGRDGAFVRSLHVAVPAGEGRGVVRIVPQAFGAYPAVVVTGSDAAGVRSAAKHLAAKVPYIANVRRGETSYGQIEDDVMQFFRLKTSAGQAAAGMVELDRLAASLQEQSITTIDAKLYTEEDRPDVASLLGTWLKTRFPGARVTATAPSRYGPVPVLDETFDLPWEVDEFWQRFRADVLPKVTPGSQVDVEAVLSESPELRRDIERQVKEELTKAGAARSSVRVICAYKQGFSWLNDVVLPQIKGRGSKHVVIRFPTLSADPSTRWMGLPIRWLQELFPIDEMMARELGIGVDDVVFEKVEGGPTTYTVDVTDSAGRRIFSDSFSPRFVTQEYLRAIPTASVHVTTGALTALVNGTVVADLRIKTDLERFWDVYQDRLVPAFFDYVRKNTGNRMGPENQPFFRDLIFEIDMSEPDFRLDLDEERISPLDALHEDLTFDTIDFFAILSGQQPGSRNVAPGRIMPIMHPVRPGRGATVKVRLTGNATPLPRLMLAWEEASGARKHRAIDLTPITLKRVQTMAEIVDGSGVIRADVLAETQRADAATAARRTQAFAEAQKAGALQDQLAYATLKELGLGVKSGSSSLITTLPLADRGGAEARERQQTITPEPGKRVVTWDHVIGPDELEQEIIPRLRTFPEINAYVAGHTYRKRNVWAMDVMLPVDADVWSQAKASGLKPVLFITTRQHSNEISATSATLRLMELIATDPKYREYLKRMNIVYNPMENPDGAANHQEYLKYTPTYILHGGYWSSVMRDVGAYIWDDDPLLPEALVRRKLYRQWAPDVYMNTHSYPAHEWVHNFAGYKVPWFLAFWIPRGYHINLHYVNDPNFPHHAALGDELRERIIEEVQGIPEMRAANRRLIHRFEKYARRYEPDPFRLEIYKGMNILHDYSYSFQEGGVFSREIYVSSLWGRAPVGEQSGQRRGRSFLGRYPQITALDLGCDMPDETPSPEWLEKVAAPGQFGYLMANLKLISESRYEIQRFDEDYVDRVSLTLFRPRPIQASRPASLSAPSSH